MSFETNECRCSSCMMALIELSRNDIIDLKKNPTDSNCCICSWQLEIKTLNLNQCAAEYTPITLACGHSGHIICMMIWFNGRRLYCPTCFRSYVSEPFNQDHDKLPIVPEGDISIMCKILSGNQFPIIITRDTKISDVYEKIKPHFNGAKILLISHNRLLDMNKFVRDYNGIHTSFIAAVLAL